MNKIEWLITGGTGTLGKELTKQIIKRPDCRGIRIYSRSEYLQWEMKKEFGTDKIAYLLGDIRDGERLSRAVEGVDYVIHAAAQKHVTASEENPMEAVKTNVVGTKNIIECSINKQVKKVFFTSTDKAVYSINLYGTTKAVAEKLILHSSIYDPRGTKFAVGRWGNVINSRGSIIEIIKNSDENSELSLTDYQMSRFWITIQDVAKFIIDRVYDMKGGEIFIPKMPSMHVADIMKALRPKSSIKITGIQPGEKLHECLITEEESENCKEHKTYYEISKKYLNKNKFSLTSLNNKLWLKGNELIKKVN